MTEEPAAERFRRLFDAAFHDLTRFVRRRTDDGAKVHASARGNRRTCPSRTRPRRRTLGSTSAAPSPGSPARTRNAWPCSPGTASPPGELGARGARPPGQITTSRRAQHSTDAPNGMSQRTLSQRRITP